jgi:hypothetical protein
MIRVSYDNSLRSPLNSMAEEPSSIIFSTRPWFAFPHKFGSGSRGLAQR